MGQLKDIPHAKRRFPKIDFFKFVLLLVALATAFSVFYYLVIFLPEKERTGIELERESAAAEEAARQFNQSMLGACLDDAQTNYKSFWESECKILGRGKGCLLPEYNANRADDFKNELKDDCFKQYPASSR